MHETLTIRFLRTTWCSPEPDIDDLIWGIFKAETLDNKEVTIKGKLEPSVSRNGMVIELTGKYENDRRYGPQFVFTNYSRCQPNGRWGTIAFLTQADGIGEIIAGRIYDSFAEESIVTLIERPDLVVTRTPGLRLEVAEEASRTLAPLVNESKMKLPLLNLFKDTKLPVKTATRVLEAGIHDPVETLKKNPFILMQFPGIAFKQSDSLRSKLKLSPAMDERILAACEQAFKDSSDQTWLSVQDISKGMQDLLEVPSIDTLTYIGHLVELDLVVTNKYGEGLWYALNRRADDEKFIAANLYQRMLMSGNKWPIEAIKNDPLLSDHQKEVVIHNMQVGGRVVTLVGGPGSGKTFTLGRILSYFPGLAAACAPTGKAAQRLTQSLKGLQATTIHRLLEPRPLSGGGFVFMRQDGDVPADVVAVDETSMVNNELGAALFHGLSPDTYIILVGDPNQLPPIGPGAMLRDLQSLGKFKELTEIRRNSGLIVESCAEIRSMKTPQLHITPMPGEHVENETNVHLVMAKKDDRKAVKIAALVDKILAGAIEVEDSLVEVQFLTATHRNQHVGREVMNKFLQERFNPAMKGEHSKFKLDDKVLCTENCFLQLQNSNLDGRTANKVFVANGEMGIVTSSLEKQIVVRLLGSDEDVVVPCGKEGHGWDLAYVITTHKFQGSEVPIAVIMMGDDFGSNLVMSREWLFTAISRAKKCAIVFAGPGQIASTVKKATIGDRKSFTLEMWQSWRNNHGL